MPNHYYDSDENIDDVEHQPDDYDDDASSVDSIPLDHASDGESTYVSTPMIWKKICVDGTIVHISSNGSLRSNDSMFSITKGFAFLGTPYRTYTIETKEYFVHDLVWRAFNGDPPEGWEVRHTYEEACKRRKYYDNSIKNLTITPITVIQRPKIFT